MADDPRVTAKTAREGLARGLQLLQDPQLPPQFIAAAEPIARAMGLLMQAERSDGRASGIKPLADQAIVAIRDALGRLQSISTSHPAAEQAMAAVAGSLSGVHGLTRLQDSQPGIAATQLQSAPNTAGYEQPRAAVPQFQAPPAAPQFQAPPAAPQFQPPPQAQFHPPPQPHFQAPLQPQFQAPPVPGGGGFAPQRGGGGPNYVGPSHPAPPTGGDSIPPPAGTIEAELGAHSPSNFYKTLSGNDIVDHGGIFVSTYNIPKIGARVTLRVHLPGGYHFDCAALVKWTREAADNPDAPPGFGAQFHGMTPDQRQLVQRYVRNREPLFYDDL